MKILNAIVALSLLGGLPHTAHAAQKPLSCEMQTLLIGLSATQRDIGITREESTLAKNKDGELTRAEVKFILDTVYVRGVGKTPDEIKDAFYAKCRPHRR